MLDYKSVIFQGVKKYMSSFFNFSNSESNNPKGITDINQENFNKANNPNLLLLNQAIQVLDNKQNNFQLSNLSNNTGNNRAV